MTETNLKALSWYCRFRSVAIQPSRLLKNDCGTPVNQKSHSRKLLGSAELAIHLSCLSVLFNVNLQLCSVGHRRVLDSVDFSKPINAK